MGKYKRVLLKLSGEALIGKNGIAICTETIKRICHDVMMVYNEGYELCIVIGGGNICRGALLSSLGIARADADYMGMLATVINAIAMQSILEGMGIVTRVQSAITMTSIAEPYIRRKAKRHMEKGRIVIFAAGTGSPFFTTDTTAVLRAVEMDCDAVFKGSQVDGVYSDDPHKNKNAHRYDKLNYIDVLSKNLGVMDASAISLAKDNAKPIIVFSIHKEGAFLSALHGDGKFTVVS